MTIQSSHNGGFTQTNSNTDYAFLNRFYELGGLSFGDNFNGPVTPDLLDADGWPTSTPHSSYFNVFSIPPPYERPGNYVVTWTGTGVIGLNFTQAILPTATFTGSQSSGILTAGAPSGGTIQKGMTLSVGGGIIGNQITGSAGVAGTYNVVSGSDFGSQSVSVSGGSLTPSGGVGRYVFSTAVTRIDFRFNHNTRNILFCHVDDEALWNVGEVFYPQYKAKLLEMKPGVIRFMDVWSINVCNMTTWNTRRPSTYRTALGPYLNPNWYLGATTSSGSDYSASRPAQRSSNATNWTSGGPADKDTVTLVFDQCSPTNNTVTFAGGGSPNISWAPTGTGSITGTTLSATLGNQRLVVGAAVTGTGVTAGTVITGFVSGQNGGSGNYTVNNSQSVASTALTFGHGLQINNRVHFTNAGGAPPAGITVNTLSPPNPFYYVVSIPDPFTITVSATQGGSAINFATTGTGTTTGRAIPTLNIGSSGAVPMLDAYSAYVQTATNSYPVGQTFQSLATLTYDAQLGAFIKKGGDIDQAQTGIYSGWPIELVVRLCGEIGAHPHICIPAYACTPMTDFTTQVATYIKNNGPSWMIPRFEPINELWNTFGNFNNTGYANNIATSYGWGQDYNNWYGKAVSTVGQDVSKVYNNDRTKYQVLCGVQTFTTPSASNARLASTQYLLQSPQTGYTATAASGWATHVLIAQYYSPSNYGQAAETTEAAAFAGKIFTASISGTVMTVTAINASNSAAFAVGDTVYGSSIFANNTANVPAGTTIISFGTGAGGTGTYNISNSVTLASRSLSAATDPTQAVTYAETSNSGSGNFTLAKCATQYALWKTWAQGFGIQKMCGYEGGFSPDYTGGGNSLVDMLRQAAKAVTHAYDWTYLNHQNFVGQTGGGFTAEYPSQYQFANNIYGVSNTGAGSSAWSCCDGSYQSPNSQAFEGFRLINNRKRRFRVKTG